MTNPPKSSFARVANHVWLHARRQPEHVALVANDRRITYAMLHHDLSAMTQALRSFGLSRGDHAAVAHHDMYVQLLIVFGFEALGIVTGSFRPLEGPECHALVAGAHLTLVQHPAQNLPARRLFEITHEWVQAALAAPVDGHPLLLPAEPDEVAVIYRSSGTTGLPKRMLLTHKMLNTRMAHERNPAMGFNFGKQSRFFAVMHFSTGITYLSASHCLRLGATFMFNTELGLVGTLAAYRPTHITMLPFQLRGLLSRLPETAKSAGPMLPKLTLQSIGATLPHDLRYAALQRICGRIVDAYGSNEAGYTAVFDETGLGTITESIEAEVTGEDGTPVPLGKTGYLRLRGGGITHGYVDDPSATTRSFRNGWFFSGDIAAFVEPGRFRLLGRPGDVLNLGGVKKACATLESQILECAPVADVALLQRNSRVSSPPVNACVVIDGAPDLPALAKIIGPIINFPFVLTLVTAIPRTEGGKIKRNELQKSLDRPSAGT